MLEDLRVVELSTGIAGAYAAKLFSDAGADVVKVEPPEGDPLRRWSATAADLGGRDGAVFRFLAASKRSVVGAPEDDEVLALIEGADLVVENFAPGVIERLDLGPRHPALVVLSITPYGHTGPFAHRPATEFTVQAECGSLAGRGTADRPPVQAGGRIAEWAAGATGAASALAAVSDARQTGRGRHVDVSWMEVMAVATNLFADLLFSMLGLPSLPQPPRSIELPSIEPTADGWVGFNTNAAQQFQDFLVLIERPDLIDDEEWRNMVVRVARRGEWNEIVRSFTRAHTTADVVEKAALLRIPAARVNSAATVVTEDHFIARDLFVPSPDGDFRHPRPPWMIDSMRPAAPGPAPRLGEHTGRVEERGRKSVSGSPVVGLPMSGLKVLDVTSWWAGPATTQLLAAMGAVVIHVEAIQRPDGMRFAATTPFVGRGAWWEYSAFYLTINANKQGITLDLSKPDGLALGRRLLEWADVVVENFTPRVMDGFGLSWEEVHAINPRAVMLRMPAFGLDGPWRDRVGFAQTMEQVSGMAWVTGHAGEEPLIPRGPCDPLGGMHAAFALQVAMAERDRTGVGLLVEVPLVEGALNLAAEQVIEHSAYGGVLGREGNRSPHAAPQGLYSCLGEDQWLAISVETDAQWAALCDVLGGPAWATDGALGSHGGRRAAHDRIDDELMRWAADRDLGQTVDALVAAGVPAAALADPRTLHTHPHLVARGFLEVVDHPVVGTHALFGMPFRVSGIESWIRTPAPTMGQDNEAVLRDLLGLAPEHIARLAADGVIGDRPAGL